MTQQQAFLFRGLYYTFFVSGFMAMITGSVMPYFIAEYNIGYDTAGYLLSATSIGALIASFFASFLIDRIGKKKSIIFLSLCISFGYAGMVLTSFVPILFGAFFLIGITRGSISNVNNSVINDETKGDIKRLNYLHIFFAVGAFLSPIIIMILMKSTDSWKFAVSASLIVSLSATFIYYKLPIRDERKKGITHKSKTETVSETSQPTKAYYKNSLFCISGAFLFFYVGVEGAVNDWLVTYLKDAGIMSGSMAQIMFSLLWIVMIFGRLGSVYLSTRMRTTTIILACSICSLILFSLFLYTRNSLLLAATVMGIGFFLAPLFPAVISICSRMLISNNQAMGTLLAIGGIGKIIMPTIVGKVAYETNIHMGMMTILFSLLLTVIFAVFLKLKLQEPARD